MLFTDSLIKFSTLFLFIGSCFLYMFGYIYLYMFFWYLGIDINLYPIQFSDVIAPVLTYGKALIPSFAGIALATLTALVIPPKGFSLNAKSKMRKVKWFDYLFFSLMFALLIFAARLFAFPIFIYSSFIMFVVIFAYSCFALKLHSVNPKANILGWVLIWVFGIICLIVGTAKENAIKIWLSPVIVSTANSDAKLIQVKYLSLGIIVYNEVTNKMEVIPQDNINKILYDNQPIKPEYKYISRLGESSFWVSHFKE